MKLAVLVIFAFCMAFTAAFGRPDGRRSRASWGMDRTDERVIAWKTSVQKYEKKRVDVSESEQRALQAIYRDIEIAYTNNQVEAMTQAMACVSNRVDYVQDGLYSGLVGGIEKYFVSCFLSYRRRGDFDSPVEFENFLSLHTKMAFFLGNCYCRRNCYDGHASAMMLRIEYGTFEVLKKYIDQFHNEGAKIFKAIAQKYQENWIAHIESDHGFIRRDAHFQFDMAWPLIELGKTTRERARVGALSGVTPLIVNGYTPKWVDEFYNGDELKLKSIYDDIKNAYTSNQVKVMVRAMVRALACSSHAGGRSQFDADFVLKHLYDKSFLDYGNIIQLKSQQECERVIATNTGMALFLCCRHYDEIFRRDIAPEELKRKTSNMLKEYVDQFHRNGNKDFEKIAQKYLAIWTAHSGEPISLKWLDEFK